MRHFSSIPCSIFILFLVACGSSADQVATKVAATVSAGQAQTAAAMPTATMAPTNTPNPPTETPIPPTATPVPPTSTPAKQYKDLTIGYVEGCRGTGWYDAYTSSLFTTAQRLGVKRFKYVDAACNGNSELNMLRDLIDAKVDVIGLSVYWSISNMDWEIIVNKANEAKIPIIFLQDIGNADNTMYSVNIHNDFSEEGRSAAQAIAKLLNEQGNVVLINGPSGAVASDRRKVGFLYVMDQYPNIKVIDSMNGDWGSSSGYTVMARFMKDEGGRINGAFFANDAMALGGIQAVRAAGKKPGTDVKIVGVDGIRAAFNAMVAGDMNATVECNPLYGPVFFDTAFKAANGMALPREIIMEDHTYYQDTAKDELPNRKY